MRLIANRLALLDALKPAEALIPKRTPKPVLLCLKLEASQTHLAICSTDLEIGMIIHDTQVQVASPGATLVNAQKLLDVVREDKADTLSLEVEKDTLVIKSPDATYKLLTQAIAEYPPIKGLEKGPEITVQARTLHRLIDATAYAVAKESTRYAFNGALLSVGKKNQITMVSTDGRRLAMTSGEFEGDGGKFTKEFTPPIVPVRALLLSQKLFDDLDEAITIRRDHNQIVFSTDNAVLVTNLIEGSFPPYEDVIPKDADKKLIAGTQDLRSAMKRAGLLTTEESKGVRMNLSKKGIQFTSRCPEHGDSTVNFACKVEGGNLEIGFNPQYLIQGLGPCGDEVTMDFSAPNRPGLISSGEYRSVLMPVNLQ